MDFQSNQFEIIKKYKPDIKDSSINAYLNAIKKICKELFNSEKYSLKYFKDTESVLAYLDTIQVIATRKNVCTAIIVVLKANLNATSDITNKNKISELLPIYTNYHKELAVKQNDSYLDNEKTDKEKDNWITQEEITDKIEELNKKLGNLTKKTAKFKGNKRSYIDTFQMYLVLNLYTMIPPIRNDFANLEITDSDVYSESDKVNFINLKTKELILTNYKTVKSYGIKKLPLPDELIKLIEKYIKVRELYLGETKALLVNTTNLEPMKANGLTKYLNKIFSPKKVSTTLLRKSYISSKYIVTHSMREREQDSIFMGHSVGMASNVYSKKL